MHENIKDVVVYIQVVLGEEFIKSSQYQHRENLRLVNPRIQYKRKALQYLSIVERIFANQLLMLGYKLVNEVADARVSVIVEICDL